MKNELMVKEIFKNKRLKINKIYNENCIEFMNKISDESVNLIFADPPYNLSKSNFKMKFVKSKGKDLYTNKGDWDTFMFPEDFENFTYSWLKECKRILKPNGAIWVAGTYHNIYLVGYLMQSRLDFEILNEVLWHKLDATPNMSCTRFVADHENFIWARKGKGNTFNYEEMKKLNGGTQMRSIWPKGKTAGGKKVHSTQKPEWLLDRVIRSTSNEGDVVFDPFMGSGSTAFVSKKLNRNFIGCEINEDYVNAANKRLKSIPAKLEEFC
ncbi:MAG: site-specific DNA-methyltransferase [Candidatus Thermoplasmatota archaeon]|nr:site-specific DNA-methyltransferase [Candidatus Thermoplasmatota archaeon]